jgi:hypothetical protein
MEKIPEWIKILEDLKKYIKELNEKTSKKE